MPNKIKVFAPAKINLFLHVIDKNQDDYHLLQSMAYFADFGDKIFVEASDEFQCQIYGRAIISDEDNIIVKAATKLSEVLNKPLDISITLHKNIPVGAGLGGGSSDAAATIKALLEFWDAKIDQDSRNKILISLGADVPCCYHGKACYFEGIGETITPIEKAPELYAVLANPEKPCETKTIFQNYNQSFSHQIDLPSSFKNRADFIRFLHSQRNDLTTLSIEEVPEIEPILNNMKDSKSDLVRMSGSGATCFALFDKKYKADDYAEALQEKNPTLWVKSVTLT